MEIDPDLAELERKIPWIKWDKLSDKARSMDTWGKGCGHTCWQIPFTREFLLNSNLVLLQALSCPLLGHCQAVDEFLWHRDFLYIRKYEPPMIRPVNFRNAIVLNEHGQILGPLSQNEWLVQSMKLLDIFYELKGR